jgi:hypothetical protein
MTEPDYTALPPRRAEITIDEVEAKAMLGLAADESLRAVLHDPRTGRLSFVVESPRLPPLGAHGGLKPSWDVPPRLVKLPLSDHYEKPGYLAP